MTMDSLIEEILAEMPDPFRAPHQQFIGLDDQITTPVQLPVDLWIGIFSDAEDEFEVDGAIAVFSTWRVETEDPLDIGQVKITDGMYAGAGRLALDARMLDERAAQLLATLPEGEHILRIKFLRERAEGDWFIEDKFDPVKAQRRTGEGIVEITKKHKAWGSSWH